MSLGLNKKATYLITYLMFHSLIRIGNEVCESDGWHSDKDFNDAVRQFHDRDARQPSEDLKSAKGLLEDLKVV